MNPPEDFGETSARLRRAQSSRSVEPLSRAGVWPDQDPEFTDYKTSFVRDYSGPYALQWPGRGWSTRSRKVSDPLIRAHLDGTYWLGTKSPWYPRFAYIDLDHPDEATLERVVRALGLSGGQYQVCTSPSFKATGNVHLIFAPRYRGKPATKKLLRTILQPRVEHAGGELYPQTRRKFRLPFGRDQYILDVVEGLICAPLPYGWREALHWVSRLEPLALEQFPHQLELNLSSPADHWAKRKDAETLLDHGLLGAGTRHEACLTLAIYFFRVNWDISDARAKIKAWIKTQHNGFSKEIVRGRWRVVLDEVDQITYWVYDTYGRAVVYPDTTHNIEAWITPQDFRFIGEVFPGSVVNQRRLFKLISYYRPRSVYPWVFVPQWKWFEIANDRNYQAFRADLENRGLLDSNHDYQIGHFSKRFRLHLPPATSLDRIEEEYRAIHDFGEAALRSFGGVREVRDALRLSRSAVWSLFNSPDSESEP